MATFHFAKSGNAVGYVSGSQKTRSPPTTSNGLFGGGIRGCFINSFTDKLNEPLKRMLALSRWKWLSKACETSVNFWMHCMSLLLPSDVRITCTAGCTSVLQLLVSDCEREESRDCLFLLSTVYLSGVHRFASKLVLQVTKGLHHSWNCRRFAFTALPDWVIIFCPSVGRLLL